MTTSPPLPDGDDPFHILGIERGASELQIKQAYAARIRTYRPDRAPDEFMRIRAAFEQAMEQARSIDLDREPTNRFDTNDAPNLEPTTSPTPSWIWGNAEAGNTAEVLLQLNEILHQSPTAAHPRIHLFLLAEWSGQPFTTAAEVLLEGLAARASLGPWMARVLETDEIAEIASDDRMSWPTLSRQPDRTMAHHLAYRRACALAIDGRLEPLLEEQLARGWAETVEHDPNSRSRALRIAASAVFSAPESADEIFDRLARHQFDADDVEDIYELRRAQRDAWIAWRQAFPKCELMAQFTELAVLLPSQELLSLDLGTAVDTHPRRFLDALVAAQANDRLMALFLEAIDEAGIHVEPREDPVNELPGFFTAIEGGIDRAPANQRQNTWLGLLTCFAIPAFVIHGWWGGISVGILAMFVIWRVSKLNKILFHETIRPLLSSFIRQHRCLPIDLVNTIRSRDTTKSQIARYADEIESDLALHAFALILHATPLPDDD